MVLEVEVVIEVGVEVEVEVGIAVDADHLHLRHHTVQLHCALVLTDPVSHLTIQTSPARTSWDPWETVTWHDLLSYSHIKDHEEVDLRKLLCGFQHLVYFDLLLILEQDQEDAPQDLVPLPLDLVGH